MSTALTELTVVPGTDADWLVAVTDADGVAYSLAQLTAAAFTVKQRYGDADPGIFQLTLGSGISIADSDAGQLRVQAGKTQTALLSHAVKYWFGMQLTFSDGTKQRPVALFGTIEPEPAL